MPTSYRISFRILALTLFLAPLFFVPGGAVSLGNAKSLLLILGILAAAATFFAEFLRRKEFSLPRHHLVYAVLLLPIVYLLSSLLSTPSSLSLLGYNFEVGTFGSILLGALTLFLASATLSESSRALQATLALFGSLAILALFATVKILSGGSFLVLGNFVGSMANPVGNWTDLAVAMGLLATLSMLALGMLPMKSSFKALLWGLFLLSTALLAVIHFAPAFILTLAASVFAFLYFSRVENGFYFSHSQGEREGKGRSGGFLSNPALMPVVLGIVSLLFLVNPALPGGRTAGDTLSGAFGVSNAEIHPTLATTLSISKSVLSQRSLFGSGPNTFTNDWLIYKPADINTTRFWAVEFPFGAGFVATQVAATGVVGSILWLAFFVLLLALAAKALGNIPESRAARFTMISALTVSLFLWAASFLYVPSLALFTVAFAFTGAFLAACRAAGFLPSWNARFAEVPGRPVTAFFAVICVCGAVFLGWTELERTLAAFHYGRAASLANMPGTAVASVEAELMKAVKFAPLDSYYLALSQLNFSKAQIAASSATGTPEANRAAFEESLGRSIQAARAAVAANPASYGNWIALGNIYAALVPDPLKIEGSYESAEYAYNEAFKRNPANPELPLLLAGLELSRGNVADARSYIRSSLALKDNYAEAYVLLARLESAAKNTSAAIASAEKVAELLPEDVGIHFELGVLKYSAGDYAGAAASLEQALKLSPDYANAKYYLALSLAQMGRKDEALALLDGLKAANPSSPDLDAAIQSLSARNTAKK
ncbi:tetratricopeptide repeat protein [Candidatus Parcubacteria bacterium]|nr:tetratricopeptide repeat protein [Candidatus Parcubacteria bacterium]